MYQAGMTSGVRLNKPQPDLCPYCGDKEHLLGYEAVLSDGRNIFP
jgi:hypothetical protein